jgi:nucleoside-diphosphate-sugar epimerase
MNKKTICITGSSGYVGEMLVDQFSKREDISLIIGIDIVDPSELTKNNSKLHFIKANLGDFDWQEQVLTYAPEIIIHTAWQIREMKDKKMQYKMNIQASDNVFDFAFSHDFVKRLVHFSTVASYGAFSDNEIDKLFTEEHPFRVSEYFYAEEKRIVEEHLVLKIDKLKNINKELPKVYVIRPAAITGPRGRFMRIRFGLQSALSGQLKGTKSFWYGLVSMLVSFTPITKKWCRQFIHEDDINDIVELLSFSEGISSDFEIFNASPFGPVVLGSDMAKAVKKKAITVHPRVIQCAFWVMRTISFGKIPTSKGGWKSYSYPIAVDGSKITTKYGYQYKMNSLDAFTKIEGRYAEYVK